MSVFKRAEWSSGLTYQQTCFECKTVITYTDARLDFRPWYADGFIYCPTCNTPLRHREGYAINAPTVNSVPTNPSTISSEPQVKIAAFCTQCGYKFQGPDRFCSQCGTKRQ